MKFVSLLGATGSIGRSAISILKSFPEEFRLFALSGWNNVERVAEYVRDFSPRYVVVKDKERAELLESLISGSCKILYGDRGLVEISVLQEVDTVVVAVSGISGLRPALAALRNGKQVLLSNKESMVAAGPLFEKYIAEDRVLPIDSEHSAIWQCLKGEDKKNLRNIILTASGGPFRGYSKESLSDVSVEDTLRHPTWRMGKKITVDSATLANKALEVMEARWIFGIDYGHIRVMVHPQSIVHGMVEFEDGSVKMLAGVTDMRLPIHYALFYPKRMKVADRLYLKLEGILSFEEPDVESFPMLSLGYDVGKRGGLLPAAFIGADELAVRAFLEGRIGFLEVFEVVRGTIERMWDEDGDVSEGAVISMVERAYRVAEDIVVKGDF